MALWTNDTADWPRGRLFYIAMSAAILLTVAVGFTHSYRARTAAGIGLAPIVIVHATLFFSWMALFFVQSLLVVTHRTRIHKRLGVAAAAVAVAMVVTAPPLAIAAFKRGALPGDPFVSLILFVGDVVIFAAFVTAAIYHRHRREIHKRLMLLATITMVAPAIVRLPIVMGQPSLTVVILLLFISAAPVYDVISRRGVNAVSLWGGLALFLSGPLRLAIAQTVTWHHIAYWLAR